MVASELSTGCVLFPEVDPMYGENNSSEAAQAERIINRLPHDAMVLADSGFGIFRVAHHCHRRGKEFLFRLTASRFKPLKKQGTLVEEEPGYRTWHVFWSPSPKDRKSNPHLPKDSTLEVFVHEIKLDDGKNLYLVSNVEADAASLGELYLRRYDVEFDIRDLKVTMDTENIRARKLDTVKKELHGSVIAYNLVAQLRRQAAKLARVHAPPLEFQRRVAHVPTPFTLRTASKLRAVARDIRGCPGERIKPQATEPLTPTQLPSDGSSPSPENHQIPKVAQYKENRQTTRLTRK